MTDCISDARQQLRCDQSSNQLSTPQTGGIDQRLARKLLIINEETDGAANYVEVSYSAIE